MRGERAGERVAQVNARFSDMEVEFYVGGLFELPLNHNRSIAMMSKDETSRLPGIDGRKFVIVFLLLLGIAAIAFALFKPERPLGGPTHFRSSPDGETP